MTKANKTERKTHLQFEYDIDAPPEKVWRALSEPTFRERWLPGSDIVDPEPIVSKAGETIAYRMREDQSPFLESVVTFLIGENADGGTCLKVIHALTDESLNQSCMGANDNRPRMRLAA
ncbi:MAG: SRPBCC domain-containing protein [Pseudomonadota bacterium]